MSTITKLSQDVTQYYNNITSPIGAIARIQGDITMMNSTKCPHELQKKKSKDEQGAWKGRVLDWPSADPLCFCCTTLINRMSITVQTLGSEHAIQGSQNSPMSSVMNVR